MFDTINGLPVHVLVVHVVVVLLPLSAIGAIVVACIPRWSRRFGVLVWIGALVSLAAAFVAQQSGEQLALRVGVPMEHRDAGMQVKFYAGALLVVTLLLWLLDRKAQKRSVIAAIVAAVTVVVALAAIWGTFRAGDSGSQAVWELVIQNTPAPQG